LLFRCFFFFKQVKMGFNINQRWFSHHKTC